jgi:hypothetical protein
MVSSASPYFQLQRVSVVQLTVAGVAKLENANLLRTSLFLSGVGSILRLAR